LDIFTLRFAVDSASFGGGGGDNAGTVLPTAGFYYVNQILPQLPGLRVGFNANSYFNGKVDYSEDWAGRYFTQKAELLTYHLSPVVAYRLTPWLSLGGGFDLVIGNAILNTAINNALDSLPDGQIRLEEADAGFGGDGGLLVSPSENLRFGLTYRSPLRLAFGNSAVLQNVGPRLRDSLAAHGLLSSPTALAITIPQQISFGAFVGLGRLVAVMVEAAWQDWSNFGSLNLLVPAPATPSFTVPLKHRDTWHVGLGVHFRIIPPLLAMAGFSFDSSPVQTAFRTPGFPVDGQYRYAGGVQFDIRPWLTVGTTYEFVALGDADFVRQGFPLTGSLAGEYSTNNLNVVGLYVSARR
jgi:long-chain fatty acid transport protein